MLTRRDFLGAAVTASCAANLNAQSPLAPAPALPPQSTLRLVPETGLFEATAGLQVERQLAWAAHWGFPQFADTGLLQRDIPEAERIVAAAARLGLPLGPVRGSAIPADSRHQAEWELRTHAALRQLTRWGISTLRLEIRPLLARPTPESPVLARSLRYCLLRLAAVAQQRQLVLAIEPRNYSRLSLKSLGRELALIGHPALKLSIDTYRWGAAGCDLARVFRDYVPQIGHVLLADFPGGFEAGTGRLPLAECLRSLVRSGYRGVIGLSHGKSLSGPSGDQAVLSACRRLTQQVLAEDAVQVI